MAKKSNTTKKEEPAQASSEPVVVPVLENTTADTPDESQPAPAPADAGPSAADIIAWLESEKAKEEAEEAEQAAKDVAEAEEKPPMRLFRGTPWEVFRVTRNSRTGAIYDHIRFGRMQKNRITGENSWVPLPRKLRRPDTGVPKEVPKEIELELDFAEGGEE